MRHLNSTGALTWEERQGEVELQHLHSDDPRVGTKQQGEELGVAAFDELPHVSARAMPVHDCPGMFQFADDFITKRIIICIPGCGESLLNRLLQLLDLHARIAGLLSLHSELVTALVI